MIQQPGSLTITSSDLQQRHEYFPLRTRMLRASVQNTNARTIVFDDVIRRFWSFTYFDWLMFGYSFLRFMNTGLSSSFSALFRASESWKVRDDTPMLSSWVSLLSDVDCTPLVSRMSRRDLFTISGGLAVDTRDRLASVL